MDDQAPPSRPRHLPLRILIAAIVGLSVTATAVFVSWQQSPDRELNSERRETLYALHLLHVAIEQHRDEHGVPPASLEDLDEQWISRRQTQDGEEAFVDGWGHPLVYERSGSDFTLRSLGRDGRPGGVGLDHDLISSDRGRLPPEAHPTLRQFLFNMPTAGIIASCLVSGALAFGLTLYTLRGVRLSRSSLALGAVKVLLTAAGAVILASIMAFHHIPWGH